MHKPALKKYGALLPVFAFLPFLHAGAQSDVVLYKGLRVSVFNFQALRQDGAVLSLRCTPANTGRYAVHFSPKNKRQYAATLRIELDSVGVPEALAGYEAAFREALLDTRLQLEPGQVHEQITLKINLSAPKTPAAPVVVNSANCPDLCFDTAFVVRENAKNIVLRCVIRNRGAAAAPLAGRKAARTDNVALNFYFVGGDRLTRGAILAEGVFLRPKRAGGEDLLLPEETIESEFEVPLENHTRFSPNLALELDPFLAVSECDRTNNVKIIYLSKNEP
jgi:hypothetical protein